MSPCHVYIWVSHVTSINKCYHTCKCDMSWVWWHTQIYICVCIYIYTYVCKYKYAWMRHVTSIVTRKQMYNLYMYICIYMCVYMYIYIYDTSRASWHMNESRTYTYESRHTHVWVMSPVSIRPVTHMNATRLEYCDMAQMYICMYVYMYMYVRLKAYIYTTYHIYRYTYEWVTNLYGWVTSHTWVSHVTRINKSCHTWMRQVLSFVKHTHTHICMYVYIYIHMYINIY